MSQTAKFLISRARAFRDRFDLDEIAEQLKGDKPKDRRASILFSVYHLLISAAVAEANLVLSESK